MNPQRELPHPNVYLADIRAKLSHSAESGEWSARLLPEECHLLLALLDEEPPLAS